VTIVGWYFRLLGDRVMGDGESDAVHRKRGAELRNHLVQSGSVALIKVCRTVMVYLDAVAM